MKYTILIIISAMMLTSCASKKLRPTLENPELDTLREESLYRRTMQELDNTKNKHKKLALCHKEEYNKAFQLFKDSLDDNKDNSHYWNQLGICYLLKGEYPKAQMYLGIAMDLTKGTKNKSIVLNNLALTQLKLGNFPEARDLFNEAIKKSSSTLTPKFNLAILYSRFGLLNKAEKIFNDLYKNNPKDPDIKYQLAHIYLMRSNFKTAYKFFSLIPKEYLMRDDVLTNYASTLYYLGRHKEALKVLKSAPMVMTSFITTQTELIKTIERSQ